MPEADEAIRADGYRVLARLFSAPADAGFLTLLADAPAAADDALGSAWNALCAAAKASLGNVSRLEDEYTELFCGLGQPRVVLYGSWHQTGSMMDAPLARLRDDLARYGFSRDPQVKEPEDHLSALLEVMSLLAGDQAAEQGEFFSRHLAPWYAKFCAQLDAEGGDFYRSAARFARCFLDIEAELLASDDAV
jgi:TorA maturation chaperone TorD